MPQLVDPMSRLVEIVKWTSTPRFSDVSETRFPTTLNENPSGGTADSFARIHREDRIRPSHWPDEGPFARQIMCEESERAATTGETLS
jgi:hypothetical protein